MILLVPHSLRIFHILASILAPMSRNDIDAIGDKFCPLSKDQVLELGLHTLWQKKISEKDEKYLITSRRDKNGIGVFTFIARCNFHGTFQ